MSSSDSVDQKIAEEEQNGKVLADSDSDVGESGERGSWSGKCDFFMSCLSYTVGLGNLWRFPYLCYKNGGGVFLIPFFIMMIFAGMPLFFLELSFGQFAGTGIINVWQVSPIFKGMGFAMFLVSFVVSIYYNMVIAWSFYYTFASFAADVPWKTCNNAWNTPACSVPADYRNCTDFQGIWYNNTCWTQSGENDTVFEYYLNQSAEHGRKSSSYEYYHNHVLGITDGIGDMGPPRWQLVLCLLFAWTVVALCLIRGIKSSGKAVYFTALFPYVVLIILLGRAVTLDGAINGIIYYMKPQWEKLGHAQVWADATIQIFFSLSPCWGGLITLASFNKFNNNTIRDSVVVTLCNVGTSVFAGFVIFAILGFMAAQLNLDVSDVAVNGAGLAFVAYPEVVAQLPVSPLWSILFFLMLITLGLGTQMTIVNTVQTTITDAFETLRIGHRPKFVLIASCCLCFLFGLPLTCGGGMYLLQLMDNYAATYSTLLIGLMECVALGWVYGWERFGDDIKLMLGKRPHIWWRIMWQFITPAIVIFIMLFTFIDFKPTSYNKVTLPVWADAIGWLITLFCISPIAVLAIYQYVTNRKGSFVETMKHISSPTPAWGPGDKKAARLSKKIGAETLPEEVPLQDSATSFV